MKRPIEDYVALALIADLSDPEDFPDFGESVFSGSWAELVAHAQRKLGFEIPETILTDAVRVLASFDLVRVTDDDFSGLFVKVYSDRFSSFAERSRKEMKEAIDDGTFINSSAMKGDYPAAYAIEKHKVFEDYAELGDKWARRAIEGLRQKISDADLISATTDEIDVSFEIPASDRVVSRTDNASEFDEIHTELSTLISHVNSQNNEIGDKLGDQREVIHEELAVARGVVEKGFFRVSSLLAWLTRALKFVIEKFSGSIIGESARKLFDLLVALL